MKNTDALLLSVAALLAVIGESPAVAEQLPPGVEQIIPRGQIAAITNPTFVEAEEAEISDDAWILGVVLNGRAHAYSLNLLNQHEVVNDRIGDTPFAAVW